jgi:NAD-reducing hydrogenase large subunit
MDTPPAERNILGLLRNDQDFVRRGIRLRQFGQRIVELTGGKKIHPGGSGPGGVHHRFGFDQRDEILGWIPEALETVSLALDRWKRAIDSFPDEIEFMGNFPSLFMGTVNEHGGLEYYEGTLRMVDGRGNCIAEKLDPRRYDTYLAEASEDYSFIKFPYYQPFGYPQGHYRVGPLARLNVASHAGTPLADREMREFKQRGQGAVCESFHFHLARLIEMVHCVERIEELMASEDLYKETIMAHASLNRREGIGSCEAPRGTLFHHYRVDSQGLMTHANLLIATAQNNQAMNMAVDQAARRFLKPSPARGEFAEGMLNRLEAAIRCFDPCLSCSTHALGQMPMVVEVLEPDGSVLREIVRDSA